ncbi:MAG: hypothetical protein HFJ80_02420 [Clostridiales bacterium]|nr:hypothetical protein [Clostridiales bacterium]
MIRLLFIPVEKKKKQHQNKRDIMITGGYRAVTFGWVHKKTGKKFKDKSDDQLWKIKGYNMAK